MDRTQQSKLDSKMMLGVLFAMSRSSQEDALAMVTNMAPERQRLEEQIAMYNRDEDKEELKGNLKLTKLFETCYKAMYGNK
jgi:hypothetical protein